MTKEKLPVLDLEPKPIAAVIDIKAHWALVEEIARDASDIFVGIDKHHLLAWGINTWGYTQIEKDDPLNHMQNLLDQFVGDEYTEELADDIMVSINDINEILADELERVIKPLLGPRAASVTLDRYQDGIIYVYIHNWLLAEDRS